MDTVVTNRIDEAFRQKRNLLNIYYTAGYPKIKDTVRIAEQLERSGADIMELGMPYSDPIADGPTIQESSTVALKNGMTISKLFEQLQVLRDKVSIPVILMGYLNPVIQFGVERFCEKCREVGVDGVILPDLPMKDYLEVYKPIFSDNGLYNIFLITPQTSEDRIRQIDRESDGFIYMVSSASVTGARSTITENQQSYFERIASMQLKTPRMIGFGISNKETYENACQYSQGAIIGSAFIKQLAQDSSNTAIDKFIKSIKS